MTESLITIAPGFDTPLEMMEACHGRMEAQLETLGRLARWLPEHGVDEQARKAAANVIRYFDVAAVNHHLDEERDLFPVLLERVGPDRRFTLESLIGWILDDHQRMFSAWDVMRARLAPIAEGAPGELSVDDVEVFSERYRLHIEREEGELFPYARDLLTNDDIARLGLSMTARRRQPTP